MAETKDTAVLDFKINEDDAIASLEKYKKSIVELKKEQSELNKAYKDGTKSLDEYASESVQLEAALKKQQHAYSQTQRAVTGIKNPFDKLNDSIKEQAKQVTIAGVSLSAFANPVTATIGVLGGLFKAYSSSTIGAKDLEFATNQLSAATGILANNFALLFSSAKDGEGFFTTVLNTLMEGLGPAGIALQAQSKALAFAKEAQEDLGREELSVRGDINERLEENAELLAKVQDSQVEYGDKIHLTGLAIINLRKNEEDLLKVKEKQLAILTSQLAIDPENEKIQDLVLEKEKEISRIKSDTERKVQGIIKLESNLSDIENKKTEKKAEQLEEDFEITLEFHEKEIEAVQIKTDLTLKTELDAREKKRKADEEETKAFQKNEKTKTKIAFLEEQNRLANASYVIGQAAGLFEKGTAAYKFLAIAQATIDTYRAASAALAPPPIGAGPLFGPILAGTTIAIGLANVAKIMDISLAAGGGTFVTKGPQLLLVGDNPGGRERVDVTPISGKGKTVVGKNMIAMAGGGTMFTDSSIMASSMTDRLTSPNIPQPKVVLTYAEFKEFTDTVQFKDSIATA